MNAEAKKIALRKIPHGLFIVGLKDGDRLSAFTATWLTQASFTPPLVVMGVKKGTLSYDMIEKGRVFSVNALNKDGKAIAEHFVKPTSLAGDKLDGYGFSVGTTGTPLLDDAICFFECRVVDIVQGGDHAVVIGEVVEAGVRNNVEPLTLKDTGWQYGG